MLVIIGWRGEPGTVDEPQHVKQGKIQLELLETMDIPFEIISKNDDHFKVKLSQLVKNANNNKRPVVLLVKKELLGYMIKIFKKLMINAC